MYKDKEFSLSVPHIRRSLRANVLRIIGRRARDVDVNVLVLKITSDICVWHKTKRMEEIGLPVDWDLYFPDVLNSEPLPELFPEIEQITSTYDEERDVESEEVSEESELSEEIPDLPLPLFADIQTVFHRVKIRVPASCKMDTLRVFFEGQLITKCPTCKRTWKVSHRKLHFPCTFRHYKREQASYVLLQWDHHSARDLVCEAYILLASYRGKGCNNKDFWVDIH